MAAHGSGTIVRILRGRVARQLVAVIAVVLALLVRLVLARHSIVLPTYITFYPVVLLAALLGGMWSGALATGLSALLVDYWVVAPTGQFAILETSDSVAMVIFCVCGISVSMVTELYHRNRDKLVAYRVQEAIQNERVKAEGERKLAESISAERQRFLDVLETLPTMISLLTPDHRIAFANRSFREKFGACQDQRCYEARFGRSTPCEVCESYVVMETGQPHHWEVILADGSLMDAYDYPFTDLDGSSLILEMNIDITERRRAENELKKHRENLEEEIAERTRELRIANMQLETDMRERERAEKVLESTMQRFYAILSNLNSAVLLVTGEGRTEFANQAFCDVFGFGGSPADQMGVDAAVMIDRIKSYYLHPDQAVSRIRELVDGGEAAVNEEIPMQNGRTFLRDFAPLTVDGRSYGRLWVHTDITELKEGEEALRESQAKLEAALASMTDSVIITDAEGRFVEFNHAFANFYRFKSKAECAKSFDEFANIFEVFLPNGGRASREMYAIQRALRGETAIGVEYTIRRKDTDECWIGSISFSPIRDIDGAIIGSVITARDVTEAKRVELALQESEKRYRNLFNAMNEGFCVIELLFDAEGKPEDYRFLEVNDAFERQTGLHGAVGKRMRELAPDHESQWYEIYGRVAVTGEPVHFMNEAKALNRFYDVNAYRVGEPEMRRVAIVFNDFSDYKRAEEALRASEEQFRNLANAIPQLCWTANADGWLSWYNERWYEYTGTTPEQMEGWGWQSVHDPDALPSVMERWKLSIATGNPFDMIFPIRGADGVFRPFLTRVMPVKDADGKVVRWFGTNTDISEQKRSEAELKKLNRTLKALSNSNQAIMHATDEAVFLKEVCRIITRDCGHAMVWIGIAEHDEKKTVRPVAYSGFEDGYLDTLKITWDENESGRGPTGTAIRTGTPSMCRNMLTDPSFAPWRENAIKRGYASSLVIPLKEQDEAWGAITIYSGEPDAFSEGEIELLTELAGDLEFGIQTLRMRAARARAEEALRESEELLGLFVEHAPAALAMFDNEMRYLHASRRWRADFGLGAGEVRGVSHYDLFPEIPERWKDAHRRGLEGEVLSGDDDRFERADGSVQWIRWEIRPWCHADGEIGGIVIFSEDTTRRKEAEAALLRSEKLALQRHQLQALAKRLQHVREEERKMVARDLHDQIGQILTAIKMDMTWVVRHLPDSQDEAHKRIKGSIELINEGVKSVRRICSGLRPGILDDLGLAAAIEWQASEFASRTGIDCKVSIPTAELHLDSDRATAIFRIFQECLTNVARHAEARSVSASLKTGDEDLLLIVQDDGKGFSEPEITGSLGVLGMKERAKACGGDVQVSSYPGKGTTVTVRVPLRAASGECEENAYSDRR